MNLDYLLLLTLNQHTLDMTSLRLVLQLMEASWSPLETKEQINIMLQITALQEEVWT